MTAISVVLLAMSFSLSLLLVCIYRQKVKPAAVFKALTSICLLTVAVLLYLKTTAEENMAMSHFYSIWIVAAVFMGVVGDLLLIGKTHRYFLLGMLCFFCGHLFYIIAFLTLGIQIEWVALAGLLLLPLSWRFYLLIQPGISSRMKIPVALYTTILCLMTVVAIATQNLAIALGAILFLVSDIFVAMQRFGSPRTRNRLLGLPLYYVAQLLMISSLFTNKLNQIPQTFYL